MGGVTDTDHFDRIQEMQGRQSESQFPEDPQTLLSGQLCLVALQESKIKTTDPKTSIICPLYFFFAHEKNPTKPIKTQFCELMSVKRNLLLLYFHN